MRFLKAQGATQLCCGTTYHTQLGQGATEYLVLLAVVLIVALVSVALLGFFPGMASDAQITQSKAYWQGASPIAIVESGAASYSNGQYSELYLRLRNMGGYPIRLTKLIGGNGEYISQYYSGGYPNISDIGYMAPGEEIYFGWTGAFSVPSSREIIVYLSGSPSSWCYLRAASSICANSTASPGTLVVNSFGFEYTEYIEGQQITKRQIGKPLVIKCIY